MLLVKLVNLLSLRRFLKFCQGKNWCLREEDWESREPARPGRERKQQEARVGRMWMEWVRQRRLCLSREYTAGDTSSAVL